MRKRESEHIPSPASYLYEVGAHKVALFDGIDPLLPPRLVERLKGTGIAELGPDAPVLHVWCLVLFMLWDDPVWDLGVNADPDTVLDLPDGELGKVAEQCYKAVYGRATLKLGFRPLELQAAAVSASIGKGKEVGEPVPV